MMLTNTLNCKTTCNYIMDLSNQPRDLKLFTCLNSGASSYAPRQCNELDIYETRLSYVIANCY